MTKAKVSVLEGTDTDAELQAQAEELARLNQASGGDLFSVTDELRAAGISSVMCIVNRTTPVERKGYAGQLALSEFSLEKMKTLFGPGRYMVQIKGPKGFLPGGGPVEIADNPESAKPHQTGDFQSFLETQARRDAERSAKLWELAMISVPALIAGFFSRTPQNDITGLVAALKPPPGPSITDLTSALSNMKALTAPQNQESKIEEILRIFESAKDLIGDGGDKDSNKGGSNWVDVIRDVIKVAPDALKPMLEGRLAAMQPTRVVSTQPTPTGAPAIAPSPQPTLSQPPHLTASPSSVAAATNGGADNMNAIIIPLAKQHLGKVLAWAEKDVNPNACAEVWVAELPDVSAYLTVDQVLEHLGNPQWFEKICEFVPELKIHRDYCDEMRLAVIDVVKQLRAEALDEKPSTDVATDQTHE